MVPVTHASRRVGRARGGVATQRNQRRPAWTRTRIPSRVSFNDSGCLTLHGITRPLPVHAHVQVEAGVAAGSPLSARRIHSLRMRIDGAVCSTVRTSSSFGAVNPSTGFHVCRTWESRGCVRRRVRGAPVEIDLQLSGHRIGHSRLRIRGRFCVRFGPGARCSTPVGSCMCIPRDCSAPSWMRYAPTFGCDAKARNSRRHLQFLGMTLYDLYLFCTRGTVENNASHQKRPPIYTAFLSRGAEI